MADSMKLQAAVEMSVEKAVSELDKVWQSADKMAAKTSAAAQKAGDSIDGIGGGAADSADQMTRAEGRMVASIKRVQTQMDLTGKSASQKFEFNIAAKGLDAAKFEPYLAQLRATEAAQAKVAMGADDMIGKVGGMALGVVAAAASFKGVASAMLDAQQSSQKLRNSLEYAAGGAVGAAQEIQYLREVTNRLGLDFATSSQAYAKFAAATKDSGVSLSQTKTVFEGIAAASAKLGLSADETQGALLALSQMASKGTVSAEELRGQLGERLPGAFNLAAKSMGVTTAELGKLLETGQVMASDFLPKFGQALKDNFQAPLNSLTQEINRFSSAWALWKTELSEGANGGGFKWLTNGLNESTASMRALGTEAGIVHKLLVAIGGFNAGAVGSAKMDSTQAQLRAMQELPVVRSKRQELESKPYLNRFEQQTLSELQRQEAEIRKSIETLAVARGKESGIKLPDLAGEYAAQQKKQTDKLNAYLKDASNAPKAVKIAAEVDKENAAFKLAVSGISEADSKYIDALKAHNARVAEIQSKGKDAAPSKAKQTDAMYGSAFMRQEQSTANKKALDDEFASIEKAAAAQAKAIESMYGPMEKEASALEEQLTNYGKTRAEIEATTLARLDEQRVIASQEGMTDLVANLEREIDARKRIAAAAAGIDARKATDDAAKSAAQEWEKTSEKIGDSITDALMRGFESGKSFADTFRDTLINMFKTMILQPTIKATVTGVMSAAGFGGASGAAGGLSGLFGSAASTGYESTSDTMFSSAGSGILGWLSSLAGKAGGGPVAAGSMYRVNENNPELLNIGDKQYLMMGSQPGTINPNPGRAATGGGSGAITIVNNTSAKIGKVTEQRLSNGERALIIQEAVDATAAQFGDPNSKTSRSFSRNYNAQRSR